MDIWRPRVCMYHTATMSRLWKYIDTVGEVFGVLGKAIGQGNVKELLKGPVVHVGFKRLT